MDHQERIRTHTTQVRRNGMHTPDVCLFLRMTQRISDIIFTVSYLEKPHIRIKMNNIFDILGIIQYNEGERRIAMKNLRMKSARAAMDLSQEALAEKVNVSRQTIGMIEAGTFNPSIRLCIAICKALNRTLNDLFWEEEV